MDSQHLSFQILGCMMSHTDILEVTTFRVSTLRQLTLKETSPLYSSLTVPITNNETRQMPTPGSIIFFFLCLSHAISSIMYLTLNLQVFPGLCVFVTLLSAGGKGRAIDWKQLDVQ